MNDDQLKKHLTPLQYHVVKENGTEPPFKNRYWNNKEEGIYVDIVTGEALFSSTDKYDSGTGWPSFTKPIEDKNISEKKDSSHSMVRVEVRSKEGNSHLGHLFTDGPGPKGMRYCINSASLKFIPKKDMEKQGYGKYLYLFKDDSQEKTNDNREIATFAAGCFWGVQHILDRVDGVISTKTGYIGGSTDNPTYWDVAKGATGHAEAVEIVFDPNKISYSQLLEYFFRLHDPTQKNRQGPDVGTQYRSAIFFHSPEQREAAEESIKKLNSSGIFNKPAVTTVEKAGTFYKAEDYHQKHFDKNGGKVCHILRSQ